MYVCMYVCLYVCMYVCRHVYTPIYVDRQYAHQVRLFALGWYIPRTKPQQHIAMLAVKRQRRGAENVAPLDVLPSVPGDGAQDVGCREGIYVKQWFWELYISGGGGG